MCSLNKPITAPVGETSFDGRRMLVSRLARLTVLAQFFLPDPSHGSHLPLTQYISPTCPPKFPPCSIAIANPPKFVSYKRGVRTISKAASKPTSDTFLEMEPHSLDAQKLRFDFLQVSVAGDPPTAMESCPKVDIKNFKELLKEENLYLITEAGEQGRLPVLILSMKGSKERRSAVVFLHSTNKCKEWLRPLLEAYASRGYVAIAIDSRYHGERASNKTTYRDVRMHAWFAAAVDTRYSVVVPIIGVQGFRWAIDNDKWQGRVDSIRPLFEEAQKDLGKREIDKEVVEKVWDRIAPGLASSFDSPYTIPAIASRPLLILNGADDPRCPLEGLQIPKSRATKAYGEAHCLDKFKLIAQPGIGHQMTPLMVKEASDWFDKFLKK
ncbi:hypothetical protein GH714_031677 [Hevea brasiliensis]|uniref:AB hydrolase-1 domain-containing protein n=1 Tax=Hevea brasiliensis TaxID=3981 RepID=A0A6A6LW11_HEVBR|nr:hypothetical protein GH714_031677 [Hevea brasiliensis]